MGLKNDWKPVGSTTFRSRGHPRGDVGEGDSSGRPKSQQHQGSHRPTLVIEAGQSQSLQSLRMDMRWWFAASHHDVKIVLLVKLNANRGEIILEKWVEPVLGLRRQGATVTRAATGAAVQPHCDQVINITRAPGITNTHAAGSNPASYIVTRGALRLEFDRLFLRQPDSGEGDVIIDIPSLQMFAVNVWEDVEVV